MAIVSMEFHIYTLYGSHSSLITKKGFLFAYKYAMTAIDIMISPDAEYNGGMVAAIALIFAWSKS